VAIAESGRMMDGLEGRYTVLCHRLDHYDMVNGGAATLSSVFRCPLFHYQMFHGWAKERIADITRLQELLAVF
jgi:hypothetical protein